MTISLEDLKSRKIDHTAPLLEVDRLVMHYKIKAGEVSAVDDVSFTVHQGEAVGLVGESGCGKTSIALSLLRLLPSNATLVSGEIRLNGKAAPPKAEGAQIRRSKGKPALGKKRRRRRLPDRTLLNNKTLPNKKTGASPRVC